MRTRTKSLLDLIEDIEPLFERIHSTAGVLKFEGQNPPAHVKMDSRGWVMVTLSMPFPEGVGEKLKPETLFRVLEAQGLFAGPLKISAGESALQPYFLIGEVPPSLRGEPENLKNLLFFLKREMESGISMFRNKTQDNFIVKEGSHQRGLSEYVPRVKQAKALVEEYLIQWRGQEGWSSESYGYLIVIEDERFFQKIYVQFDHPEACKFKTLLSPFRYEDLSSESKEAIADFLLLFNGRIRLVRASILKREGVSEQEGQERKAVFIEVVTPYEFLNPSFVNHAIGALMVGAQSLILELKALMNRDVARTYLTLHP